MHIKNNVDTLNECLPKCEKRGDVIGILCGGFGNGVKHVSKSSLRLHHIARLIRTCYLCSGDSINR